MLTSNSDVTVDGSFSFWDLKHSKGTSKRLSQSAEITCIKFWKETQMFVLTTQNGLISFWLNNVLIDSLNIDQTLFSIEFLDRIQQCVLGTAEGLSMIATDPEQAGGRLLNLWQYRDLEHHKGIVKCLLFLPNRLYSAGYDRRLIAYDASGAVDNDLVVVRVKHRAHLAAINCLAGIKVDKDTCLLATGGFDSYIKIWNDDLTLFYRLHDVPELKTDLVFVPRSSQLWVCFGFNRTRVFDVKNGEELTELVTHSTCEGKESSGFGRMAYSMGLNVLIGAASQRELIVMQESEATPAAMHLVKCPFTSLVSTTSSRLPITIFLGDMLGRLHLWRRCGQSRLTFKKEQRAIGKGMNEALQRALSFTLQRQVGRLTSCLRGMLEQGLGEAAIRKNLIAPLPSQLIRLPSGSSVVYAEWLACFTSQLAVNSARARSFTKLIYLESELLLIALCEDSVVYLLKAEAVADGKPGPEAPTVEGVRNSVDSQQIDDESDPFADLNMKCFAALVGHHALVTCATIIPEGQIANFPLLITSGWDQRLCFWRLPRGNLVRAIEAAMEYTEVQSLGSDDEEVLNKDHAKENAILGLDYHVESRTLAYCSANSQVYLQTFGKTLAHFDEPVRVLRGHSNEVNAICWAELETSSNPTLFSASEDESIRFWFHGEADLQPLVNAGGSVTDLHWDSTANLLLASVENVVKIYNIQTRKLCQQFEGHTDNVTAILRLFDTGQYMTAGPDGRVLLWESPGISSKEALRRPQSKKAVQASQSPFDKADLAAAKKANNPAAAFLAAARAYSAALRQTTLPASTLPA